LIKSNKVVARRRKLPWKDMSGGLSGEMGSNQHTGYIPRKQVVEEVLGAQEEVLGAQEEEGGRGVGRGLWGRRRRCGVRRRMPKHMHAPSLLTGGRGRSAGRVAVWGGPGALGIDNALQARAAVERLATGAEKGELVEAGIATAVTGGGIRAGLVAVRGRGDRALGAIVVAAPALAAVLGAGSASVARRIAVCSALGVPCGGKQKRKEFAV
jgi:hypothetical protein